MSAQLAGILLGIFSGFMGALIMWGAFAEQRRSNRAFITRRP